MLPFMLVTIVPGLFAVIAPRTAIRLSNALNMAVSSRVFREVEANQRQQRYCRIAGLASIGLGLLPLIILLVSSWVAPNSAIVRDAETNSAHFVGQIFGFIALASLVVVVISPDFVIRISHWEDYFDPEYLADPRFKLVMRFVALFIVIQMSVGKLFDWFGR